MSYHGGGRYDDSRGGGRDYPDRGRDRERGEFRGGGSYDRSRSRDEGPRQNDRGGYSGGRGRGGGGRGPRATYRGARPNLAYPVKTNMFALTPKPNVTEDGYQYLVTVFQAKKVFTVGEDEKRIFSHSEIIPNKEPVDATRAGELIRGILNRLRRVETLSFAYDGNSLINSAGPLFEFDPDNLMADPGETNGGHEVVKAGKYGPEDPGGHNISAAKKPPNSKDFFISVKKNSEDEDEDTSRWIRGSSFCVRLTFICKLDVSRALALVRNGSSDEKLKSLKDIEGTNRMFDNFLKDQMFNSMQSPGKNPNRFFFQANKQESLLGNALQRVFQNDRKTYAPFVGLTQNVRFGEDGNVYFEANECVNYFNREFFYKSPHSPPGEQRRVPLVNPHESKIAGVSVNLKAPINDEGKRKEIEQTLKKLTFHLEYKRNPPREWYEKVRSKNKTDAQIEKMKTRVRKNLKIKRDDSRGKACILWAADDPQIYSFEKRKPRNRDATTQENQDEEPTEPPIKITLAEYFMQHHGIRLMYPSLPIVHIGDKNWYPVEMLYQAFDRTKDANSPGHVSDLLQHFDSIAGNKYVERTSSLLKQLDFNDDSFEKIGLVRSCEPVQLSAKVLDQPRLKFGNQDASVNNGDWNLNRMEFAKPSELSSFAVIDFSRDGRAKDYIVNLFNVMQRHGMALPCNVHPSRALDKVYFSPRENREPCFPDTQAGAFYAFDQSISKAKKFFWYDTSKEYRSHYTWFKSRCTSETGENSECLLLPDYVSEEGKIGVMLPTSVYPPTHVIELRGEELLVRLMVVVALENRNEVTIDPFDFIYEKDVYYALQNNGSRHKVNFSRYVYESRDGTRHDFSTVGRSRAHILIDPTWQLSPISMMLVYLEENDKKTYSMVKMTSQFFKGIPSQCCVHAKFSAQRSKDQYCSNIALKMNTKLMNVYNQGRGWNTISNGKNGIAWISEAPTMVMGVDMSHGIFQEAASVIGGSVCLDEGCMQLAQTMRVTSKSHTIPFEIMSDITKTLFIHFFHHRKLKPTRILFYRAGVSEGDFDTVLRREVAAIRKCFFDIRTETEPGFTCENPTCEKGGCLYCTPLITVVVCQTQHNIKIVPIDDHDGNNVPSGTIVDKKVIDYKNSLKKATRDVSRFNPGFLEDRFPVENVIDDGFDFFMTSQGGLKGTSKPIYYRIILNENAVWLPQPPPVSSPLTRETLELITYHMAFQYGTATKAVRSLPVLKYSSRLAEMGLNYFSTLRNDHKVVPVPLDGKSKDNQRKLRDGTFVTGEKFVRSEFEKFFAESTDNPDILKPPSDFMTEMVKYFSPYEEHLQIIQGLEGALPHTRPCAFPHLSA